MDDYQLTVSFATECGDAAELEQFAERLLDALVAKHADLGPVTAGDFGDRTISATIAFDVGSLSLDQAIQRGMAVIEPALADARVTTTSVANAHIERVRRRDLQPGLVA